MESRFFNLDLPDDIVELVSIKAAGMRLSFPTPNSKHNPLYRRKRNRSICERANQGATIRDLVKEFNLTKRHILRILKENNIQVQRKSKRSTIKEIKLMLQMNTPKTEIAKRLNISRQWLYELLKEIG